MSQSSTKLYLLTHISLLVLFRLTPNFPLSASEITSLNVEVQLSTDILITEVGTRQKLGQATPRYRCLGIHFVWPRGLQVP